ncbi:MAG: hypothetical protein HOV79_27035 [Hamadaea sp.]|nr:hypothetical protein [Hamadaea sp.]
MTQMSSTKRAWAESGAVFAAVMMIMIGVFQVFQGISAIAKDGLFVTGRNYTFELDTAAWGWVHLLLGIVVAVVGGFVLTGADWARGVAIAIVVISAITQFLFIPYYPLWSLVLIAIDVFVIWALANYPKEPGR